jgi:DNA polymerase-3 subunit alpha
MTPIKGLGEAAMAAVLNARKSEGGAFKDVFHAIKSAAVQKANKRVWENLIKAGAFDSLESNRAALLQGLPGAIENADKGNLNTGLVSLFDEAEMASLGDSWNVPEGVEPWRRSERLKAERETLGLYVSGHPLEEYTDAIRLHTVGGLARLKESIASGKLKDRDEVSIAAMVTNVNFKTNKNGEQWAILMLEDLTDKIEALLMASSFDSSTKKKTRPYENYRHFAMTDFLLRVTGELRVETNDSPNEDEDESGDQIQVKIFVKGLESLEDYQGRDCTGAIIELPQDKYPVNLLSILTKNSGSLPLTLKYQTANGEIVKIKTGAKYGLTFNPNLAERLKTETGCLLQWT